MQKKLARVFLVTATMALVASCVSNETTWYEQRCQKIGLSKGTADFEKCIARDQAWIEADKKRAASTRMR
jgi:hypothetical protein